MSQQSASSQPYTTGFDATVERIDGREVVLDETYFYAESGGQPADRGVLGGVQVDTVQFDGEAVVHTLAKEPAFEAGETVDCGVDEAFRTYCMRAHTASHVLYGAGRRVLDDLGYGGFDISAEKVRVDFETSTEIDDDVLLELESLVNRAVWESRPVTWTEVPREDALARDDIAFNAKTEEGVLSSADSVRIVDIDGWDVAACGGTHVENTREIGPVTVLDRSNPGEGLTRVEFAVGPTAIEHRTDERWAAFQAANTLEVGVPDLPDAALRLQEDVQSLKVELAEATTQLVDARVAELREDLVERDGREWLVGAVDGLDSNDLGDRVRDLAGDAADVVALVGGDGGTFVVVGAADGADAAAVVDDVTSEFGGGGGGSASFAQGGGLDAAPEDVVSFLR